MDQSDGDLIVLNGIDGRTGRYLVPPMTPAEAAAFAKDAFSNAPLPEEARLRGGGIQPRPDPARERRMGPHPPFGHLG